MSNSVTVAIPDGEHCMMDIKTPCIFARYTKKWNAYNCALHHQLLKGGQRPQKCLECRNRCKSNQEE